MMKTLMHMAAIFMLSLCFAAIASAQGSAGGTVLDVNGAPMPDVTVNMKSDTGKSFSAKTNKDGKYNVNGVQDGTYTVVFTGNGLPAEGFTQKFRKGPDTPPWDINFKQVMAQSGNAAQAQADQNAFKSVKEHFDAGTTAFNAKDFNTALTEYTAAEQGVNAKDTTNHAMILSNIGRVDDAMAKYDDAAGAYQKAIDLKPMPDYYVQMSTSLINAGTGQKDPAVLQQKITDASAACEKAVSLDTATPQVTGTRCWKNMGIVLSNKGDLKQAIDPLQKATTASPKDAQSWFLLGSAYTGTIDSTQQGDKEVFNIPPGTIDAFQKCVDADANGPYAAQCKAMIDSVNQMSGGQSTKFGNAPPPPAAKSAPAKKK